jgi:ACR3 family arsenite transporter
MSTASKAVSPRATASVMGLFERFLSVWVALAIAAGVTVGWLFPDAFGWLAGLEFASVNLPVAVLIWAMIYPMMIGVDFTSLRHAGDKPKGLTITLVVNWLIKPFSMAALGILFFQYLFAPLVTAEAAAQYIAGMIILGAAPCTAMVFVWSQLTRGDPTYTLVQVALNDVIMIIAFAPIVGLLLGVADILVPWETLLLSVVLYVVLPLLAGWLTRRQLVRRGGTAAVDRFTARLKPLTIGALLATVVLLFAFQAGTLLAQPLVIGLIAVPLLVQTFGIFALAWAWAWWWRVPVAIAGPAALIGTSNFFELAVAVAISLFGLQSGAALATVVGVLVEVPVMLALVRVVNANAGRLEARCAAPA